MEKSQQKLKRTRMENRKFKDLANLPLSTIFTVMHLQQNTMMDFANLFSTKGQKRTYDLRSPNY